MPKPLSIKARTAPWSNVVVIRPSHASFPLKIRAGAMHGNLR